jgi:hypothetical protein
MTTYQILIRDLFLDTFWEILYFPLWWYSRGLKKTARFCWQKIKRGWRALALSILLVNFFKPMYGQRGLDVYILSLGTHFWQLLWRIFLFLLWVIFWLLVLLIWLTLPIFLIWQLIY